MSTDIGALQKQYAKLRRKQHHACVVMSDFRTGRSETDVHTETDNLACPEVSRLPDGDCCVEGSLAMLTLSVPIETEKSQQDLIDPVSPTVFGETKCFFVQNVKKKKTKHSKHPKRSIQEAVPKTDSKIQSDSIEPVDFGAENKTYHGENEKDSKHKRGKRVSFSEKVETLPEPEVFANFPGENNQMEDTKEELQNGISVQKAEQETDTQIQKEKLANDISAQKKQLENIVDKPEEDSKSETDKNAAEPEEISNSEKVVNEERKENESNTSPDDLKTGNALNYEGPRSTGAENVEKSLEKQDKLQDNDESDSKPIHASNALHTSILKNSKAQGIRNPAVKFSKQYYPSRHSLHKKQRTSSESADNTNKQSIYQHFMMTKRQLSLDSTLGLQGNKAAPSKSIEFPFPVHSINEHKIKAGMKLGLYDQKALEKLERTRKVHKPKLPHLTSD